MDWSQGESGRRALEVIGCLVQAFFVSLTFPLLSHFLRFSLLGVRKQKNSLWKHVHV